MPASPTTSPGQPPQPVLAPNPTISAFTGKAWRQLRRALLQGSPDGNCRVEKLPDGILRYTAQLSREDVISILNAEANALPQATIKIDRKRSIHRVWLRDQSFVLKTYHHLHRWLAVSPDRKSWLGAHRLNNNVPCYAWFRKHDRSSATIIYGDAGNRDLYMPEWSHNPDTTTTALFRQAGGILAALHRQNIFHADTKPGNFVYMDSPTTNSTLHLIDTDDVRCYWHLSTRRRLKNLAQFMGCTREDIPGEAYIAALTAFLNGYMQYYPTTATVLVAQFPAIADAIAALYPERHHLNHPIVSLLAKRLQAYQPDLTTLPS